MIPVRFYPEDHRYMGPEGPYISSTQLIKKVCHEFDTDFHAEGIAERRGMTPEYWKDKWEKKSRRSLDIGNAVHELQEALSYASGIEVRKGKKLRVQNSERMEGFIEDYYYWPDGVYNELLLWNSPARLAGRADRVIMGTHLSGYRYADIEDHKTNERIRTRSWYDEHTGYRMLKAPVDHLMDCEFSIYSLQLSVYQLMLEMMGFAPGTRTLLHYPPVPEDMADYPGQRMTKPIKYELPYLREEVVNIIQAYAQNNL